jgi:3-oxoacyl-[acyl-carrier protein] reductase
MYSDLSDQVVLVTGSSRGIGASVAAAFASVGSRVVLHGRDRSALAAVHRRIVDAGGRAQVETGDVTRTADLEQMRARISEMYGPVDVLVANAGSTRSRPKPIEEIAESEWRSDVDTNLTATFLTVKCFLPAMKRRGSGTIITMSSAAGRRATAQTLVAYGAAKAGIQIFTQDLAAQVGPNGVRANCLAPEAIMTDENQDLVPVDHRQELVDQHPIRRLGTPADVARAALFLASDASGWISGVVIDIAGGAVLI